MPVAPYDVVSVAANRSNVRHANSREISGFQIEALRRMMALTDGAAACCAKYVEPVPARLPIIPDDLQNRIVVGQFYRYGKCVDGRMLLIHKKNKYANLFHGYALFYD